MEFNQKVEWMTAILLRVRLVFGVSSFVLPLDSLILHSPLRAVVSNRGFRVSSYPWAAALVTCSFSKGCPQGEGRLVELAAVQFSWEMCPLPNLTGVAMQSDFQWLLGKWHWTCHGCDQVAFFPGRALTLCPQSLSSNYLNLHFIIITGQVNCYLCQRSQTLHKSDCIFLLVFIYWKVKMH